MTDFMLMFKDSNGPPREDVRYDLCGLVERCLPETEEDSGVWHFPGKRSENHMTDWLDRNRMVVVSFRSVFYRGEYWHIVGCHRTEEVPEALQVMQGFLEMHRPVPPNEAPRPLRLYYSALLRSQHPLSQAFYTHALDAILSPFQNVA